MKGKCDTIRTINNLFQTKFHHFTVEQVENLIQTKSWQVEGGGGANFENLTGNIFISLKSWARKDWKHVLQ